MLRELLRLMADEGLITIGEASSKLGVSPELVKQALRELVALGLVRRPCPACPRASLSCPGAKLASYPEACYALTEGGLKIARASGGQRHEGARIVSPKRKGR